MRKKRPKVRKYKIPVKSKQEKVYSVAEMNAIEDHITNTYGSIEGIIHDQNKSKLHIDLVLVAPDEIRPYWKIVTMGMGKYKMKPEDPFSNEIPRCELVMAVEPAWDYRNLFPTDKHLIYSHPNKDKSVSYKYPIKVLREIAISPLEDNFFLKAPCTFDFQELELDVKTDLNDFLILNAQDVKPDENIAILPNGDPVVFYQVVPITTAERLTLMEPDHFEETVTKINYIFWPGRKSVV